MLPNKTDSKKSLDENSPGYRNADFYSRCNGELIHYLMENKEEATRIANKAKQECKENLIAVSYDVADWPVVLDEQRVAEFNSFIKTLPEILEKAIRVFFEQDSQAFSTYMNESSTTYDLYLKSKITHNELILRHDFAYSNETLKLLEVNAGSNLGGWELDWLHLKTIATSNKIPSIQEAELSYRKVVYSLVNAIGRSIANLKKENRSGNILFKTIAISSEISATLAHFVQMNYQLSENYQGGRIFLCSNLEQADFHENGKVFYHGESVDAVILLDLDMPEGIMSKLVDSYISKQIVFPDSPIHTLFGNKILLALVHEEKVRAKLTAGENNWIRKYIPWTVKLNRKNVDWENNGYQLTGLLREKKDCFVLKKTNSCQGKDVIIGKYTKQEAWEILLKKLENETSWIAQEFCAPDVILAPNIASQLDNYIPVWGMFDFGNAFGGSFARAIPAGQLEGGIVNCAVGAIVLVALEISSIQAKSDSHKVSGLEGKNNKMDTLKTQA